MSIPTDDEPQQSRVKPRKPYIAPVIEESAPFESLHMACIHGPECGEEGYTS